MAAATVLHVGDDVCHRILVMEDSGMVVHRSECSVDGIRSAFALHRQFSVIAFNNAVHPLPAAAIPAARALSTAPLVLFENPSVEYNSRLFDVVIAGNATPEVWLRSLQAAIAKARRLCKVSRQLCEDCAKVNAESQILRAESARIRKHSVDVNEVWGSERNTDGDE